jgi:hypothetical protein
MEMFLQAPNHLVLASSEDEVTHIVMSTQGDESRISQIHLVKEKGKVVHINETALFPSFAGL